MAVTGAGRLVAGPQGQTHMGDDGMKVMKEPGIRGLTIIEDNYPEIRRIYVSDEELDQLILALQTARDNPDNLPIVDYGDDSFRETTP